ncbi:hypothetical protein [Methanolobus profundi]|uniref:Uncharacterized protein n=1 Tax=Methanolobus profundi TaxID=487685 RepID=A0A1I4NH12_9EURY|nr:hypothetical protein [Methanolobus profundi]SFM14791.1 hypothetical protein SAMN04488696_0046 [Methanolobus profundi]
MSRKNDPFIWISCVYLIWEKDRAFIENKDLTKGLTNYKIEKWRIEYGMEVVQKDAAAFQTFQGLEGIRTS